MLLIWVSLGLDEELVREGQDCQGEKGMQEGGINLLLLGRGWSCGQIAQQGLWTSHW